MEHLDNQPDGHKADEPDALQLVLERYYRSQMQAERTAVDYDLQTGMAGDE
jgi:hypothetical protein